MSEYKNPICVRVDDPICSASSLEGTIIGILFDKTGAQIKQAITARKGTIDAKVQKYQDTIGTIEQFVEDKKKILKELDEFHQSRCNDKRALLKPLQDMSNDLYRDYQAKRTALDADRTEAEVKHDKETQAEVGKKAVVFEEQFDQFKKQFEEIDEFIRQDLRTEPGVRGYRDQQGITGIQGPIGSYGSSGTLTTDNSSNIFTITSSSNNIGIGGETPHNLLNVTYTEPTKEDKAAARISSLRDLLASYDRKMRILRDKMIEIEEEKRRLDLMLNNIDEGRTYKLDLNKLSAFGFEDIEIK